MRLIEANAEQLVYQMHPREKALLLHVLKLYPLVPPAHQKVSKAGDPALHEEQQKLLDEALAAHREELRRRVQDLLAEPQRFVLNQDGYRFSLQPAQREWLLQVLNDIRLGSWLRLGSPEEDQRQAIPLTEQNAPYLLAMDACALFETDLMGEG